MKAFRERGCFFDDWDAKTKERVIAHFLLGEGWTRDGVVEVVKNALEDFRREVMSVVKTRAVEIAQVPFPALTKAEAKLDDKVIC